jgi:hypothetical protein
MPAALRESVAGAGSRHGSTLAPRGRDPRGSRLAGAPAERPADKGGPRIDTGLVVIETDGQRCRALAATLEAGELRVPYDPLVSLRSRFGTPAAAGAPRDGVGARLTALVAEASSLAVETERWSV